MKVSIDNQVMPIYRTIHPYADSDPDWTFDNDTQLFTSAGVAVGIQQLLINKV